MTTEQTALQRLKGLCEAATPGPWVMVSGNDADLRDMIFSKFKNRLVAQTAFAESRATGNFIAIARTALPALIDYCEALDNYSEIIAGLMLCDDKTEADKLTVHENIFQRGMQNGKRRRVFYSHHQLPGPPAQDRGIAMYRWNQHGEHYALSQDYELMRELLERGPLFGVVDYDMLRDGDILVDPVLIRKKSDDEYIAGVRGCAYLDVWPEHGGWQEFANLCVKYNLKFVLPNQPESGREE